MVGAVRYMHTSWTARIAHQQAPRQVAQALAHALGRARTRPPVPLERLLQRGRGPALRDERAVAVARVRQARLRRTPGYLRDIHTRPVW